MQIFYKLGHNIMFLKKLINKGYEADQCEICSNPFKLIKFDRIHKCKRCLKFICITCGDSKEFVIDEEGKMTSQKHRVCVNCRSDIQLIRQNMEHYGLKWAYDSKLAIQWLFNLRKQHKQDYEYPHFLALYFRSGNKFNEETQIIDKDVIRGRTDFSVFNYSMKEFFYTVQLGVEDQHETRCNIANVLYAIAARFQKVGYCQGMSGIAAFLLCFASEESAFIIFCDLLEHIFPKMFFERSNFGVALVGLLAEIHFLKEYYEHSVIPGKRSLLLKERQIYSEQEIAHMKVVIELAGTKALLSVFIGILSFSNLMFVWEELKSRRSFEVVERAFLAIIYLNRNAILEERSFKKLEEYFEKLDGEAFREAYHDIQIDQELRRGYLQEYFLQNSKKWTSSGTGGAYSLSKVTSLTEAEIKALEKAFCPGFTPKQMVETPIITEEDFLILVEAYYRVLKHESGEGESILEISGFFLRKIFRTFQAQGRQGLLFREFVCCLSICTKSSLKERVCAILGTFKDYSCHISLQNFNKLMGSLLALSPPTLELKKGAFNERTYKFFSPEGRVTMHELEILLNDEFMLEMSLLIAFETKDIIAKSIQAYLSEKIDANGKEEERSEAESVGQKNNNG